MHFLQRGAAPNCLSNYRHGQHQWTHLTPTFVDRAAIRTELEAMQGRRCAYCECDLDQHGQHIEHFRQRDRYSQGTFDWDNLFLSCKRKDSCGKHKDECGPYNHADLIKPDVDDPEHDFLFGEHGTISLRQGLSPQENHRAEETLRIFNLDAQWGPLRKMRELTCMTYLDTATAFQEMAQQYPESEWLPLLEAELAAIQHLPFCTAIKHTLLPA
jgi:uncharacterized protein (TIGR02646 family)